MSTLQTLQDEVIRNFGRDDAQAYSWAKAAINVAAKAAAAMFKPVELFKVYSSVLPGSEQFIDLSKQNWALIANIYRVDTGEDILWLPNSMARRLLPASPPELKFWTKWASGVTLYGAPTVDTEIGFEYIARPTTLVESTDELEFSTYDEYITAFATGVCFAGVEENDSALLWQKVAEAIAGPSALIARSQHPLESPRATLYEGIERPIK